MMKRLTANKAKMLRLCREYGMAPKNALFTKVYRSQTWWLEWIDVQDSAQSGIWKVTFTGPAPENRCLPLPMTGRMKSR